MPNIVLMYSEEGRLFGNHVLEAFIETGLPPKCVIITKRGHSLFKTLSGVAKTKRPGFITIRLARFMKNTAVYYIKNMKNKSADRIATFLVPGANSAECEKLLRKNSTDILVIASTAIIKRNILRVPKIGTINAHDGLLPGYGGLGSWMQAIRNGDRLGVSSHFVDEGIDSGPVLLRKEIVIDNGDTMDSVAKKLIKLRIEMLVDTAKGAALNRIKAAEQDPLKIKTYYNKALTDDFVREVKGGFRAYVRQRLDDYRRPDYKRITYDKHSLAI